MTEKAQIQAISNFCCYVFQHYISKMAHADLCLCKEIKIMDRARFKCTVLLCRYGSEPFIKLIFQKQMN